MRFPRPLIAVALVALTACELEEDDHFSVDLAGGKGDGAGPSLLTAQLGETLLDLYVDASGDPWRSLVPVRLDLRAGDSMAAVMRASDSTLDPYLLLKDRTGATLAESDGQALLPMAPESDAVISYTATEDETLILFAAGGRHLDTAGSFRLDLVPLGIDPGVPLGTTFGGVRPAHRALRELEPEVDALLSQGVLVERTDGMIEIDGAGFSELPLEARPTVRRLEADVNFLREFLFAEFLRFASGPVEAAAVARAAAAVWDQVRR